MGRQNTAYLYARVSKPPVIQKNAESGEFIYGMVYVDAVRGFRPVEDGVNYLRHDHPLIMSREKGILEKMTHWKENDIVFIKGVVTTTTIEKTSYCPNCTDDEGNATSNSARGNLVYVTPIYVDKLHEYGDDKSAAIDDIVDNREISNQILVLGTLIQEPKFFTTKKGIQITQYPIAVNRKYEIKEDNPHYKTDWPIVKSYGEQARGDKVYLQKGAEILVDGFLQARTVHRKCKCASCGKEYEWADHMMELVPYATEYLTGHKNDEQVAAESKKSAEELKQFLFTSGLKEDLDDELKSDDTN